MYDLVVIKFSCVIPSHNGVRIRVKVLLSQNVVTTLPHFLVSLIYLPFVYCSGVFMVVYASMQNLATYT